MGTELMQKQHINKQKQQKIENEIQNTEKHTDTSEANKSMRVSI